MSKMADDKKMVHMLFEAPLVRRIDDFRFKHRFENRTDAVKWLLDWALAQKPVPEKGKGD